MDKLTQFVSRSFETNSGVMSAERCLNLSSNLVKIYPAQASDQQMTESAIKSEEQQSVSITKTSQMELDISVSTNTNLTPVAKNWLISDISKHCGIDLSINSSHLIYNTSVDLSRSTINFHDAKHHHQNDTNDNAITSNSKPPVPSTNANYSSINKCFKNGEDAKTISPNNSCSSSPSPQIDLEDSKSCSEIIVPESVQDNKYCISDTRNIQEDTANSDQDTRKCKLLVI